MEEYAHLLVHIGAVLNYQEKFDILQKNGLDAVPYGEIIHMNIMDVFNAMEDYAGKFQRWNNAKSTGPRPYVGSLSQTVLVYGEKKWTFAKYDYDTMAWIKGEEALDFNVEYWYPLPKLPPQL